MNKSYDQIYNKLKKDTKRVSWDALEDHYKRGAIFLVEQELDLTEVATKVAIDDVDTIRAWMKVDGLRKPKGDEIIEYQNDEELLFDFLIIQPYVLVQEFIDL